MSAEILRALVAVNLAIAGAVVVMLIARSLLRRGFGARIAYAAWLIVPLVAVASFLPARSLDLAPAPSPVGPAAEATMVFLAAQSSRSGVIDWAATLVCLWALGSLGLLLALAVTQRRALGLIGRLRPDGAHVRSANTAVGPAILCVFKPRIMLPADFEQRFSDEEQRLILAHEGVHLAGQDVRINALVEIARCLCWFNPLAHVAARTLRIDQELACDEAVVGKFPKSRRVYAEALLKTQVAPTPLPLGCYWPQPSPKRLKERIVMLTQKGPSRARRLAGAALIAVLAAGSGAGAWAAKPSAKRIVAADAAEPRPKPSTAEDWPPRDKPLPPGVTFLGSSVRDGMKIFQWRDAGGVVRTLRTKGDDIDDRGVFKRWVIGIDPKTGERASFPPGASAFPEPRSPEAETRMHSLPPVGPMTAEESDRVQKQPVPERRSQAKPPPVPLRFAADEATVSDREGLLSFFGRVQITRVDPDGEAPADLAQIASSAKALVIRCERGEGGEPSCETSGPADPALVERLKARLPPTGAGDAVFLLRRASPDRGD